MSAKSVLNILKAMMRIIFWSAAMTSLAATGLAQTTGAPEQPTPTAAQTEQRSASPVPATAAAKGGYRIEETHLGSWESPGSKSKQSSPYPLYGFSSRVISADGRHVAWVSTCKEEGKTQVCVVLDGKPVETPAIAGVSMFGLKAPGPHSVVGLSLSPDGKRVAFGTKKDDKKWEVVVDGQASAEYDGLFDVSFLSLESKGVKFSSDNRRVAYAAKKGEKWSVVLDGQAGAEYDALEGLQFSTDGKHLIYEAKTDKKWSVVLDGQAGPDYDELKVLSFSREGKHLIYEARREKKWVMVVDGQASAEYDGIAGYSLMNAGEGDVPSISDGGQRFMYAAKKGEKLSVVVDGKEGEGYDELKDLQFSPDGKRVAYAARRDKQWSMVVDGRAGEGYDELKDLRFSPDGKRIVYADKKGEKWSVMVDGQAGEGYGELKNLRFSPGGRHIVYEAKTDNQWSVVVDGHAGAEYDHISENPLFSPDGEHIVYVAGRGGHWSVVEDGKAGEEYEIIQGLKFGSDGKRLVYVALRDKQWSLVVDGKVVVALPKAFADWMRISLAESPDGEHMEYLAWKASNRNGLLIGVDDNVSAEYSLIVGGSLVLGSHGDLEYRGIPAFGPDDSLEFLAVKSGSLYRVKFIPVP
jgi:Tol biopolymer transport system component